MAAKRKFIPNQVFVGLPWKNVRSKYDRIIEKLSKKYPLYFTIVGRNDNQNAEALFEIIKGRIESSSYAVFRCHGRQCERVPGIRLRRRSGSPTCHLS